MLSSPGCQIIQLKNNNGVPLEGLLFRVPGAKITILHVHGSCGNYWSALFLPVLARHLIEIGINLFSINTSAHDCIVEGSRDGKFAYIGGSIVNFSECVLDIQAALDFLAPMNTRVVLQGHSLGCDRIVH